MPSEKLPVYLFSKTSHPDIHHIPVLGTRFFQPQIDFSNYDAIVFTSKQAVAALEQLDGEWKMLPVLAVAESTANTARSIGMRVMDSGAGYGENLAEIIIREHRDKRWLYLRPKRAASDFALRVKNAGIELDEVVVYETYCDQEAAGRTIGSEAVLVFTSPFTIECFLQFYRFEKGHKVVVIGETTRAALPEGVEALMPSTPSIENAVALAKQLAGLSLSQS